MTIEEDNHDVAFNGLMKSLNLDESKFKIYKTNFNQLTYSQLSTIKTDIESQLSILFDVLTHYYNADMNTELLTSDGFPRNDIDVLGIRLVRVRIIRLRNDHKEVLNCIEHKLMEQLQANSTSNPSSNTQQSQNIQQSSNIQHSSSHNSQTIPNIPFAWVQHVVPNSPASSSGLQDGDQIAQFGPVHIATPNKIATIAQVVRNSLNQPIPVIVVRNSTVISLQVSPNSSWGGQGMLGCRIIPL